MHSRQILLQPGMFSRSHNIVNVYFPCYTSTVEYTSQLADSLSFVEDVLSLGFDTILLGDMNFGMYE